MPVDSLKQILEWQKGGAEEEDTIDRLRARTVPPGFVPHPWISGAYSSAFLVYMYVCVHTFYCCVPCLLVGKTERTVDKLRSILAQMEYSYQVRSWSDKGVPFRTHIYVPEVHHLTGKRFHEREDEAHVFKVNSSICDLMLFSIYDLFLHTIVQYVLL